MPVERQSHEESMIQWKVEKLSLDKVELSKTTAKLLQTVDRMISEYTITYNEFVKDVFEYMSDNFNGSESKEDREDQVNKMYEYLMNKYTENGESSEE